MDIILTGGHSGIGLELSKMLLKDGHHLGLILRSEKRKADAIAALGTDKNIEFFFADLSKRDQIARVIEQVHQKFERIDGLFNNAGVLMDKAYYSDQGNEMQFEINALTPYILTQGLKPLLEKAENPFVVNTATGGIHNKKSLNVAELKKPKKFVKLLGSYMNSKFALVLLMNHLEKSMKNVRMVSVDPGPNRTNMTKGPGMPNLLKPIRNLFFPPPTKGASKMYKAAFDPKFKGQSGIYISGNKVYPMKYSINQTELKQVLETV